MYYTQQEKQFIVEKYNQTQSCTLVQRAWRTQFFTSNAPSYCMINDTVNKFQATRSVANKIPNQNEYSQKRINAIETLEEMFAEDPSLSIRKAAQSSNIFIVKNEDYEKRQQFALWYLGLTEEEKQHFICIDESIFCLQIEENKQNNRLWMEQKPQTYNQKVQLKSRVYNPLPNSLEDLKVNIERELKNITKDALRNAFLNLEKRCQNIIQPNGGNIECNLKQQHV